MSCTLFDLGHAARDVAGALYDADGALSGEVRLAFGVKGIAAVGAWQTRLVNYENYAHDLVHGVRFSPADLRLQIVPVVIESQQGPNNLDRVARNDAERALQSVVDNRTFHGSFADGAFKFSALPGSAVPLSHFEVKLDTDLLTSRLDPFLDKTTWTQVHRHALLKPARLLFDLVYTASMHPTRRSSRLAHDDAAAAATAADDLRHAELLALVVLALLCRSSRNRAKDRGFSHALEAEWADLATMFAGEMARAKKWVGEHLRPKGEVARRLGQWCIEHDGDGKLTMREVQGAIEAAMGWLMWRFGLDILPHDLQYDSLSKARYLPQARALFRRV
ncbi:uncharacterized protein RHOBADRAFT_44257 [Rhodotorula graminis WP1]|uniref:Uncharacterized protein n=1 Tax=Rhodotorula graminis (strain WP1) TaxID=578459 RepID=A0A194S2B0_RHOGW|nr:uncharacterized protein RHOBADRAFT_44257 [Rhodotorula graminis WP1]KPV74737.1 hypothetical protein RHOBADRAFT_44257 [Rhodotorula graminis WP1]